MIGFVLLHHLAALRAQRTHLTLGVVTGTNEAGQRLTLDEGVRVLVVPIPAPVLIKEFTAGLPYAGVQTHFTWQSVPEGYEVPQVSGIPPVDYPF